MASRGFNPVGLIITIFAYIELINGATGVIVCRDRLPSYRCLTYKAAGYCTSQRPDRKRLALAQCQKTCALCSVGHPKCWPGFKETLFGSRSRCSDIDECKLNTHKCGKNAFCKNTYGSYYCLCQNFHRGDPWVKCEEHCSDHSLSCPQYAQKYRGYCSKYSGQKLCPATCGKCKIKCAHGFNRKNGTNYCEDVDECTSGARKCPAGHTCMNTQGSFVCKCPLGYVKDLTKKCKESCRDRYSSAYCQAKKAAWCYPELRTHRGRQKTMFYACPKTCGYCGKPRCTYKEYLTKANTCRSVMEMKVPPFVCKDRYHASSCAYYKRVGYCTSPKPDKLRMALIYCQKSCALCSLGKPRCQPGYTWNNKTQKCQDVDECKTGNTTCGTGAVCQNTHGSYYCKCLDYYRGDPYTKCEAHCADTSGRCAIYKTKYKGFCSEFKFRHAAKYQCPVSCGMCKQQCGAGYTAKGSFCKDIDECRSGTAKCPPNHTCINYAGRYVCQCPLGYIRPVTGKKDYTKPCTATCKDKSSVIYCKQRASWCVPTVRKEYYRQLTMRRYCVKSCGFCGKPVCKSGSYLDNKSVCQSIKKLPYKKLSDTKRTRSGLVSAFRPSNRYNKYTRYYQYTKPKICKDLAPSTCVQYRDSGRCNSTRTYQARANLKYCPKTCGLCNYSFKCLPGYSYNQKTKKCEDYNECSVKKSPCGANTTCHNTHGGFYCKCTAQHRGDPYTGCKYHCADFNTRWCKKYTGKYSWCKSKLTSRQSYMRRYCPVSCGFCKQSCSAGWSPNKDSKTCTDVNECKTLKDACPSGSLCRNRPGSYRCLCPAGWTYNIGTKKCIRYCVDLSPSHYCRRLTTRCSIPRFQQGLMAGCAKTCGLCDKRRCGPGRYADGKNTCVPIPHRGRSFPSPHVPTTTPAAKKTTAAVKNTTPATKKTTAAAKNTTAAPFRQRTDFKKVFGRNGSTIMIKKGSATIKVLAKGSHSNGWKIRKYPRGGRHHFRPCHNCNHHHGNGWNQVNAGVYVRSTVCKDRFGNATCRKLQAKGQCASPNNVQKRTMLVYCALTCNLCGYRSLCLPGYTFNVTTKQCQDIDECAVKGTCGPNAVCHNSQGGHLCKCTEGFKGNPHKGCQKHCSDYNPAWCHKYVTVKRWCSSTSTFKKSYMKKWCPVSCGMCKLECSQGYQPALNGKQCVDYDECANNKTNTCPSGSRCENHPRGFRCVCPAGSLYNKYNNTCSKQCTDYHTRCQAKISYCSDPRYQRHMWKTCPQTCKACGKTICPQRQFLNGTTCQKINYCSLPKVCGEGATCVALHTKHGFRCACPAGYHGNPRIRCLKASRHGYGKHYGSKHHRSGRRWG